MTENNGWHLIRNEYVNLKNLDWISDKGIPDKWITLFGYVFDEILVPRPFLEFKNMKDSDKVIDWIKDQGFYHKMKYHLHRTICIDIDMDAFLLEWHLSFPSEEERIAWLLTMNWNKYIEGWA